MTPYIDIHTHNSDTNLITRKILNLLLHKIEQYEITPHSLYSAGWHPWYINKYNIDFIEKEIEKYSSLPNIIAIGECGIDRAIDISIDLQKKVFLLHINASKKHKKPLIIHSVRAYSDILQTLNEENYDGPLILHGYRGNIQQVRQFAKFNTCYSFGSAIMKSKKNASTLEQTPVEKLFFETDDEDISIEKIYLRAAEIRKVSTEELKKQIEINFNTLWRNELD
ncbi:MAG: TatD family hydrolase [Prolixibacteraceae bacterium]|jgi:TatD DNase family protein|nr:TatD family hydrolase [Prolixibacteraceae bacterium]